jgi:two-component system cell cycle sensor histidine kinase/response regulator CckA
MLFRRIAIEDPVYMGNISQCAGDPVAVLLVNATLPQLAVKHMSASFDGLTVFKAESASDAMDLIRRIGPDVIISNVRLPGADGIEFCRRIKSNAVTSDIPVILVSESSPDADEAAVRAGLDAGAHDYLQAGMPAALLLKRVECLITAHKERQAHRRTEESLRQVEEQLRHAQKMESIGTLAGGIAHDFNNLLTAIIGYSELVLGRLDKTNPIRTKVEEIHNAGERAVSLTRQLLAFSRKQTLEAKVIDLNGIVMGMSKLLHRLIGEDIEQVMELAPELGQVKADSGQVEQVLMNLAVNARDAMPEGGKLLIQTGNVDVDINYARQHLSVEPGPYVMLAVSDNGIGMDAETRRHIFEPFFTTKEKGKGTGLGLCTVYGIVKQNGGDICVDSQPGRGTTIKIYLPRVEVAPEVAQAHCAPMTAAGGTETVLVVEDEDTVRKLARVILHLNGYTVLEARNADEALVICEQHSGPIHLMVTDIVMPGMSGRALFYCIAPLRPEMRVLYISGYIEQAIFHSGVFDQPAPFLQKPFKPNALTRKVREVLDENKKAESAAQAKPYPTADIAM